MKKIYENIEDIYIKGSPTELSEIITSMDITLQNIAEATEQIADVLIKYSQSNSGKQYEKTVQALSTLENTLYDASLDMNEMQHQIAKYQNKVLRYEGLSESACVPNPHMVHRIQINVDGNSIQFGLADMLNVSKALEQYSDFVYYRLRDLIESKNSIASIWLDSQYTIFSSFIDEICMKTVEALKIFNEYVIYLNEKIKELN